MQYTREQALVASQHHGQSDSNHCWVRHLPQEWQSHVQHPQHFDVYRDHELDAERTFGYNRFAVACYYSHHFQVTELCSDDDEEFYVRTLYGETLHAWLLQDGRWLVCRQIDNDEQGEGHAFYSFSSEMPR